MIVCTIIAWCEKYVALLVKKQMWRRGVWSTSEQMRKWHTRCSHNIVVVSATCQSDILPPYALGGSISARENLSFMDTQLPNSPWQLLGNNKKSGSKVWSQFGGHGWRPKRFKVRKTKWWLWLRCSNNQAQTPLHAHSLYSLLQNHWHQGKSWNTSAHEHRHVPATNMQTIYICNNASVPGTKDDQSCKATACLLCSPRFQRSRIQGKILTVQEQQHFPHICIYAAMIT